MVLEVKVKWWAQKGDHRNMDRKQTDQTNEQQQTVQKETCYFYIMQKWILYWRGKCAVSAYVCVCAYLPHPVMLCEIVPKGDFKWFSTNNNKKSTTKIRCTPEMCIRFRLQMHIIFSFIWAIDTIVDRLFFRVSFFFAGLSTCWVYRSWYDM